MLSSIRLLLISILLVFTTQISAQTASSATPPITSNRPISNGTTSTSTPDTPTSSTAPDVHLVVPELHVGRIELIVEKLSADLNLNAKVAGLVQINAGVAVSVEKVNITIADVDVNLELIVRLGNLVEIVERVFDSLDLNPLLISLVGNATELIGDVIGAVDGLLGSITQGGKTLNFLVDNLGNIVQDVTGGAGDALSQIVGNYQLNMTEVTGSLKQLSQGQTQKTFSYEPLNALVDIVFNTAGQVVQAVVQKATSGGGNSTATASASASATPTPVSLTSSAPSSTA
ncbi:hypothetical protein P153DRAFT_389794 [Dothidotthia symphoricarpi CBS 119687]|uniref:Uncharacterized protein n=1 Tax=Dothidotthia symphoricarpi CBS 119687 TaxID=1392245 RepID=A0A6A6A157_9PLEO|nr:uncharacterized protein P153DRAFT_389794 [Dothidotthia symphoricarpi CBS 119687]KAF2124935.1 hypothetical protein P153DRAFT_389794 [Dothidotthia symphoricarpi CBS 119687]